MQSSKTYKGIIIAIVVTAICCGVTAAVMMFHAGHFFPRVNGLLVLSQEENASENERTAQEKAESCYTAAVKRTDDTLVIKQSDAQRLYEQGFITEGNGDGAKRPEKLPLHADGPTLWAKGKEKAVEVGDKTIPAVYGGNIQLGDSRGIAKKLLVVPDTQFDEIPAAFYRLFCLEYRKNDPKFDLGAGSDAVYKCVEMQLTSLYKA